MSRETDLKALYAALAAVQEGRMSDVIVVGRAQYTQGIALAYEPFAEDAVTRRGRLHEAAKWIDQDPYVVQIVD